MNKKTKKQNEKKSRPTVQHTIKKDSILKLVLRFSLNLFILQLQVLFLVTKINFWTVVTFNRILSVSISDK